MALLLGASLTFAFAPFSQWWLVYLILPVWLFQLANTKAKPWLLGGCFGFGYFGAGLSWVHVSIADFGGLPLAGSLSLMFLLCGYLSLYYAALATIAKRFIPLRLWPLALPFIWLVLEWLRAHILSGFPWLSLGYSQLNSPLAGWLPVIGEIGVSAMLIAWASALAIFIPRKAYVSSALLSGVVIISGLSLDTIEWVQPNGNTKTVSMVQGNIAQSLRWEPEQDRPTIEKYLHMSESLWQQSDLIIWPEAAIPILEPMAEDLLVMLDDKATSTNTGFITGIVNYHFASERIYNNLLALGIDQPELNQVPYRYMHNNRFAKHHLLPIGEFIPFESWLRGLAPIFDLPMSSFTRGDYVQRNLHSAGMHIAPAICFEIAFPEQIRANITPYTDAIITVSNDAWFGNSHGPHQHLEIAQMRAKEFGLPVFRSTNTGISAFIDHRGEISSHLTQFATQSGSQKVALTTGATPYRQTGPVIAWLFFGILFVIAMLNIRSQKTTKAS